MKRRIDVRYLGRRLAQAALVLWMTFTLAFGVLYILPGDPARLILGGASGGSAPTEEQLVAVNAQYGFDKPLWEQYFRYLGHVVRGDFGLSYQNGDTVGHVLGQALPSTLALAGFALLLALVFGLVIGTLSVYVENGIVSRILESVPPLGVSLPTFWTGMLLIQFFSFDLGLFPASGDAGFATLVMPAIAMAIPPTATIAQILGQSLSSAITEPYIAVAKGKGATKPRIFFRHAFRNALVPVVTVAGMVIANLFAYSAITETVFSRNGIGFTLQNAVKTKDIPVVLGVVALIGCAYVLVNLVVDLLYPLLDPKITMSRGRRRASSPEGAI